MKCRVVRRLPGVELVPWKRRHPEGEKTIARKKPQRTSPSWDCIEIDEK